MLKEDKSCLIYDFVFCGFGLSAMLLLLEMMKCSSFKSKKFLLIDKDQKKSNDKTFSFWTLDADIFNDIPRQKWKKTQLVRKNAQKQVISTNPYFYITMKSIDFYKYVFAQLNKWKNVEFTLDEVLRSDKDGEVQCKAKNYYGRKIIHSAFELENLGKKKQTPYFIWQHFGGWYVKFEKPVFEKTTFTMMDFRTGDKNRNSFFYVLPYTEKEALIEYTIFDNHLLNSKNYDEKIRAYIQNVLDQKKFEIKEKEFGKIPMTTKLKQQVSSDRLTIGTGAGTVRPSTGYSFSRNVEWAKNYAKDILEAENFLQISFSKKNKLYHNMDKVFLEIFNHNLVPIENLFCSLFTSNPPKRILNFLTEKSTLAEMFKVMFSVKNKKLLTYLFIKTFFVK